jgi:predicted RNA-binding Zn-ribbon protein involved in translation (DUF1610 family)
VVEAMPAAGGGGGFNRAHPYVGVSGRTQAKRRKQLAVRWYCVSCEKSSEHEQNVVTLLCLQCGVSMVSSHRRLLDGVLTSTATAPSIELAAGAVLGAKRRSDHASDGDATHPHAKMPAAIGDSTNDCVCIVLQGALSLARVRLCVSR